MIYFAYWLSGSFAGYLIAKTFIKADINERVRTECVDRMNRMILDMLQRGFEPKLFKDKKEFYWNNDGSK